MNIVRIINAVKIDNNNTERKNYKKNRLACNNECEMITNTTL